MIGQLLPAFVKWDEAFGDRAVTKLWPQEAELVAGATPARRREFVTARDCARRALTGLGIAPAPIVADTDRVPVWPAGVVGSIAHCPGYRVAAVASSCAVAGLGIDAEPNRNVSREILTRIASQEEKAMVWELFSSDPGIAWDRLLFSAKEAIYKAWYPMARRFLACEQVVVTFDPFARSFGAGLHVPGMATVDHCRAELGGRWAFDDDLLITAVAIEPKGTGSSGLLWDAESKWRLFDR